MHPGQKLKTRGAGGVRRVTRCMARSSSGSASAAGWSGCGPRAARPSDDGGRRIGHMPLPPYIKRADRADDRDRYQTVFAARRGSVAAPTAGLHFTPDARARARARAASRPPTMTLHVGYGTFQPVRVDEVEEHRLEAERYEIDVQRR